jgi:hypothetical protein
MPTDQQDYVSNSCTYHDGKTPPQNSGNCDTLIQKSASQGGFPNPLIVSKRGGLWIIEFDVLIDSIDKINKYPFSDEGILKQPGLGPDLPYSAGLEIHFNPNVDIQKTVHLGNKATCSDGSELVSGAVGDQATYCYKITNTGDTYLKNFEIVDPDCKPSALPKDDLDGTLLPPNQSKWVRYLTTIPDGGVTSSGKVEAEAAFYTSVLIDAEHGGGTVTAEDPAGVAEGIVPLMLTEPPTDLPTTSPTLGPTDVPTVVPTDNPTQGPTPDFCEYNKIDFTTDGQGDDTSEGYVFSKSWGAYGMQITAVTDEKRDENKTPRSAYIYQTGDDVAGKALIIQKDDVENLTPTMNPAGGEITITLDLTHDKGFKLDFFNVASGGSIVLIDIDGEYVGGVIVIEAIAGLQAITFGVNGVYRIVVTLFGPGALAQMNVCRNPEYTPSPAGFLGLAPPTETSEPTVAPAGLTVFNEEPECPADVKLVSSVGETSYGNFPITIVSQDTSSVTFEVKGSWQTEIAYLYAQFHDTDKSEDCFAYETIDAAFSEQITANCMEKVPISIVSIFISGSSLSVEKDDAEVPECCHAPEQNTFPVAEYTFQIYCVPQCPDAEASARKLPEANEGSKLRGTAIRSATGDDRN